MGVVHLEMEVANQIEIESQHGTGSDLVEHEVTYRRLLRILKWAIAGISGVLVLMATFLT